jgi:predicted Kef-type K+ transport protein
LIQSKYPNMIYSTELVVGFKLALRITVLLVDHLQEREEYSRVRGR